MTWEFARTLAVLMALSGLGYWVAEGFKTNFVYLVGGGTLVWGAIVAAGFLFARPPRDSA